MTTTMQTIGLVLFVVALLHTFSTHMFEVLAHRHPRHAGLFHLLGEVEVVFGFWAFVLMGFMALVEGRTAAVDYAESRHYTEPLFVFVVMVVAASRPVLEAARAAEVASQIAVAYGSPEFFSDANSRVVTFLNGRVNNAASPSPGRIINLSTRAQVAYVGNDVNDAECLRHVGLPICVADAYQSVKGLARLITRRRGGDGAVREVCDLILSARGAAL